MNEQVSQLDTVTQHPHLQEHPEAVQDIALAHEMAIAGDPHESEAARLRAHAELTIKHREVNDPGAVRTIAAIAMNRIIPDINRAQNQANQKYAELQMKPHDYAADARAALKATKR